MHSSSRLLLPGARLAVALLISVASLNFASAQVTVTTDPVGFTTTSLLASPSTAVDSFISNPFTRLPEFIGGISSVSGSTITLIGNPLTANQFVYLSTPTQHNHYYALIGSAGTKEGHTYQITANGTGTVTVDISQDDLSGISANSQVVVIPYWTPATIFPASDAGTSFTATTSPPNYQTLIRVPNYSAPLYSSYAAEYYFNGGSWQRISGGVGDDDPLLPDGYFVVRNAANVQTGSLTNIGSVLLKKLAVSLTATGQQQDNPVSMVRPVNVALDATGLNPANGSFGAGDQLLLFNNSQAAFDKSPSAIYTYDTSVGNNGVYIGGWRLTGDSTPSSDRGADIIPVGTGFVVRKAAAGLSPFWTNAFPVSAVSAVSRKIHGNGVGALDINLPLTGNPGIECRQGGATQVVFTFPVPITINTGLGTGGAKITSGTGTISNVTGSATTTVTVNLSGGTNAQYTTVTLIGVNDGVNTNDVADRIGNLTGDTNADKSVNSSDIGQTKSQSFHTVTQSNVREDLNFDGSINSSDIGLVKSKSFTGLP